MAGLKKPAKKKDGKSSPVLVIFLVFFILISIGLGVWGYYGYDGQEALKSKAETEVKNTKSAKFGTLLQAAARAELQLALGFPVPENDMVDFKQMRPKLTGGDESVKQEPIVGPYNEFVKELKKDLGDFDEAKFGYSDNYRAKIVKLQDELKKSQSQIEALRTEARVAQDQFAKLNTSITGSFTDAIGKINKGNAAALAASSARNEVFPMQVELAKKLQDELAETTRKSGEERENYQKQIEKLERDVKLAKQAAEDTGREAVAPTRNPGEPHALMLDISRGKPLWDQAVGKIIRINWAERQVTINLGANSGLRPETTFNVFGIGPSGRPEGRLKAICEVTRVTDNNTSIARITSLYDAEGTEIPVTTGLAGRVQREAENSLKEGDLLFNMAFGLHVAVAGYVPWQAELSKSPAEQMRQMNDYMYYLVKQGVTVDAYLDLITGEVQGKLTNKTRILIVGDAPPVPKDEDKEKDLAMQGYVAMRKEAVEKGMFLISADNMAVVAGFRRARNANDGENPNIFKPGLPTAGAAFGRSVQPMGVGAAPKEAEPMPKEMEKKEEEKKE
ncbi:MAG: hypothetical protein K2X38_07050 [Gemmataceae bacterium]|nr:hypothetical protein [Gemmataceae bacterium]